jgi:hypothetical protein
MGVIVHQLGEQCFCCLEMRECVTRSDGGSFDTMYATLDDARNDIEMAVEVMGPRSVPQLRKKGQWSKFSHYAQAALAETCNTLKPAVKLAPNSEYDLIQT